MAIFSSYAKLPEVTIKKHKQFHVKKKMETTHKNKQLNRQQPPPKSLFAILASKPNIRRPLALIGYIR